MNGSAADPIFTFLAELAEWKPVLDRAGVGGAERVQAAMRARIGHVSLQRELVASGVVEEAVLYRSLAAVLGIGFLSAVAPADLVLTENQALTLLRRRPGCAAVRMMVRGGEAVMLMATDCLDLSRMRERLRRDPALRQRLRVVPPSALRRALVARMERHLLERAVTSLAISAPELSARTVTNGWQGLLVGAGAVALLVSAALWPLATLTVAHILFVLVFLACILLRVRALAAMPEPPGEPLAPVPAARLPVYTILVPLYREAEMVPQLLLALGRLEWPRAKLEIKLLCEADDAETLAALRQHRLRPFVEVVTVPPGGPRTKPKALAYALPLAAGELIVVYDAEDRPHPLQLVEAWQRFAGCGPEVACLQAPLHVTNGSDTLISRLFALDYAGLFRGLLPYLSRRRLLLPLGGTSNHFRGLM